MSEVKATLLILFPTFYAKRLHLPSFTPLSSLKHRTLTPGYRTHSPSVSLAGACHKPIFVEHLSTHSSQLGAAEGTHPGMPAQQEAPGPSSRRHAAHPRPRCLPLPAGPPHTRPTTKPAAGAGRPPSTAPGPAPAATPAGPSPPVSGPAPGAPRGKGTGREGKAPAAPSARSPARR